MAITELDLGKYQLGWSDVEDYVFKPRKGLSEEIVREMSAMKSEPGWMLDFRLSSLRRFERKPMVRWFAEKMPDLDFDDIYYYIKPTEGAGQRLGQAARVGEEHLGQARHPASRAQVPGRSDRPVRVGGRVPPQS